jgi:deoxyribodipyrimidine photolyase-related protein
VVEPGEWRVQEELKKAVPGLIIQPDHHFLCSKEDFATHVEDRKQLRLEFFYREMRRRYKILMEDERPAGGAWNFDAENRGNFAKSGPGPLPAPVSFAQDSVTQEVIGLVEKIFPGHPGSLKNFNWPVTRSQALKGLEDFIFHRLPNFGRYQDAMWTGEPWLYHSRLSTALNLKLLQPAEVIGTAEKAYQQQQASLAAVEGFIRQILGWREYVRGIYWYFMPDYLRRNSLNAKMELPKFYWTGETEMNCLREVITQTLNYGYAHHIQRLMVTGLYALLLGVKPVEVHKWYLAIYVDAVEWVEAPNVLGMSQFADGGLMASKPYIATGKYIQRMSNYCAICRYKPEQTTGPAACPFTTLYWDFLMRHENILQKNQRMLLQLNNLRRFTQSEKQSIKEQADQIRASQLS